MFRKIIQTILVVSLCTACSGKSRYAKNAERLEKDLADLRSIQAEQTSVIANLRSDLRAMSGRVQEVEHTQATQQDRARQDQARVGNSTINTTDSALASYGLTGNEISDSGLSNRARHIVPKMVPQDLLDIDELYASRIEDESAQGLAILEALKGIRSGDFGTSTRLLESVMSSNQATDLKPLAIFWLGVSYEGTSDADKALPMYLDLATNYPKHRRASAALLRQGELFESLGDTDSAKLTYQKLVSEYPGSSEAKRVTASGKL